MNFFITLGFGGAVGFAVGMGGKLGKVRNPKTLLLFGLIGGLIASYVGWISWIFAFSKQEALLFMPSGIANIMQLVAELGAWSFFGWTPTGIALYIIWTIEAIMIIGTSTLVSWAVLCSTPFCERCDKWIERQESFTPLDAISDPQELKSQLEKSDYTPLQSMKKKDAETDTFTQVKISHCPSCQENFYLTIKSTQVSLDADNVEKRDEKNILENLIITADHYRTIKAQWT